MTIGKPIIPIRKLWYFQTKVFLKLNVKIMIINHKSSQTSTIIVPFHHQADGTSPAISQTFLKIVPFCPIKSKNGHKIMISMHFCPKVIWHLSKKCPKYSRQIRTLVLYIYGENSTRNKFMQITIPPLWVRSLLHIKSSLHSLTIRYAS